MEFFVFGEQCGILKVQCVHFLRNPVFEEAHLINRLVFGPLSVGLTCAVRWQLSRSKTLIALCTVYSSLYVNHSNFLTLTIFKVLKQYVKL